MLFSLIINRQFSQAFDESLPNSWILQHLSFSLNPQLSKCLFRHLVLIFTKLFINSCQICHFRKTHNYRNTSFVISFEFWKTLNELLPNLPLIYTRHLSRCPFLSSLCKFLSNLINMPLFVISFEYLAKSLMIVLAHSPYLSKLAFCQYSPLCHLIWDFARPLMDSCPIPIFSNLPFLCKSPTVNMPVLLSHCFNPCQIRRFRKICHFRKTHNYRHASFVILV